MRTLAAIGPRFRHSVSRPLLALRRAIRHTRPDLIIPGDDRAVRQLHRLHDRLTRESGRDDAVKSVIERSLGAPEGYKTLRSRNSMQALAARLGIRVPDCAPVRRHADLVAWHGRVPLPWVLKTDGSTGGTGVRVVHSLAEAQRGFDELSRRLGFVQSAKLALGGSDPFAWSDWLDRSVPAVSVQRYIAGRPANCAVACWQGQVMDGIAAEVLAERHENGPSMAIRIVDGSDMLDTARRLTTSLGMTGMVGLDFIIEDATALLYLVEVNPRGTPICHLQMGKGRDLVGALTARAAAAEARDKPPVTPQSLVAFFPELHLADPDHPALRHGYHDVPSQEPALMRALLDPPVQPMWRLLRGLRRRRPASRAAASNRDLIGRAAKDDWAPPPLKPGLPM